MILHILLFALISFIPILVLLLCFIGLPLIYFILWVNTFDRLGKKRAMTLFGDLSVLFVLGWMITPPQVFYKPVLSLGDISARIEVMLEGGQNAPAVMVIDWLQTTMALLFNPPIVLWAVVLGGVLVLKKASKAPTHREN